MKRILITGGTGFFGKSILDYLARHACDFEITILSRRGFKTTDLADSTDCPAGNLSTHSLNPLNPLLKISLCQLIGDVRTFDLGVSRFDSVIHAATPARADVPDDEMRSIIINGTANALQQAKKCGAEKFMMVSSGGVYGKGLIGPVSETDEPHPYTAYGIAKLEAEQMAVDSGLHVLLPRCFAFVGRHLDRNAHFAIGNFIRDALEGNDIVINGDGTPMRSYLYADDLVEWLFAILEHGESGRVYNVGSDEAISIRDLATLVRDTLGSSSEVKVLGQSVPGAANCYVPNIDRIKRELGMKIRVSLKEAIRASAGLVLDPVAESSGYFCALSPFGKLIGGKVRC